MKTAGEKIKENYMDSWYHPQVGIDFNLADLDGQTCDDYGNKDRDGKSLYNGQVKAFKDYYGKIRQGKIYHNINNMWWVIVSEFTLLNIPCFAFFDDTLRQRIVRNIPKIKVNVTWREK